MFENYFAKKASVIYCLAKLLAIVLSVSLLVVLSLNVNFSHISKTLMLFGVLGVCLAGMFYFLDTHPLLSRFCALLANLAFALILLWIRQTYDSTSSLAWWLYVIAYCSLLLALCLGGGMLMFESLVFFYIALLYALFDFSVGFWGFVVVFVLGFYFALKSQKVWIKLLNFFNLLAFVSLVFFFEQISWFVLLWVVISAILLSHLFGFLSSNVIDKLALISLMCLVVFFEKSDFLISSTLGESWVWIFAFLIFAWVLWFKQMQFFAIFMLLLVIGVWVEPLLVRQDEVYFYYWLLFFMVWIEFIVRWLVWGFFVLWGIVAIKYLGIDEESSRLWLFLTLCFIIFLTTIIVRSKNAI